MASEVILASGVDCELVTRRQYEFNDQRRVKHSVQKGIVFLTWSRTACYVTV